MSLRKRGERRCWREENDGCRGSKEETRTVIHYQRPLSISLASQRANWRDNRYNSAYLYLYERSSVFLSSLPSYPFLSVPSFSPSASSSPHPRPQIEPPLRLVYLQTRLPASKPCWLPITAQNDEPEWRRTACALDEGICDEVPGYG
jgi:hypothetical protein